MLFPFSFMRTGGGFDPDAQAFFDRVTTAGGTLTTTEKNATNQLVLDMKSAGIWTAMKAIYPMVGASAAACAQNLKSSSFTGTFTSGWTFASTGVTPNGTSAYMNTGLQPTTQLTGTSTHVSYYSRTSTTTNGGVELGTWNTSYLSGIELALHRSVATPKTYLTINSSAGVNSVLAGSQTSTGLFLGCRTSNSLATLYRNGSSIGTNTNSVTVILSSFNVYIGASNDFGTAGAFSTKQCAFASIGDGLTDTQASNFYTAVQTFNQTLSRSVGPQIVSDADAQAYINRVYTAGGTLTNTEANAVNQLTVDMKAAGIWTAMKAVYPMVGSSAAACAQNLKSSSFTGTFSSGWTFSSTGATPNGTSAYMDTAFNPVTQSSSQTSFYMSVYIRTNSNAGFPYDIGNANDWNTGVKFTGIITRYLTNTRYIAVCDPYSTGNSETDSRGFYLGGTNGSSTQILYKNGTNVLSGTSAQQGFESNNLYISAVNSIVGGASGFSNKENAFASISDGLSSTQAADFYTCVQTFNTTLSRQV